MFSMYVRGKLGTKGETIMPNFMGKLTTLPDFDKTVMLYITEIKFGE